MVKLHRAKEDALLAMLILECSIGIIWSSGDKYIRWHKVEWGGVSFLTLGQCSLSVGKPQHHRKNGGISPRQHQSILVTFGVDNWLGSSDSP